MNRTVVSGLDSSQKRLLRPTIFARDAGIPDGSAKAVAGGWPADGAFGRRRSAQPVIISALLQRDFFGLVRVDRANALVWNCLKRRFFLLHPAPALPIQGVNPWRVHH